MIIMNDYANSTAIDVSKNFHELEKLSAKDSNAAKGANNAAIPAGGIIIIAIGATRPTRKKLPDPDNIDSIELSNIFFEKSYL